MGYFFDGRLYETPAVMSRIDDSGMLSQNQSVGNVVAILGKSVAGKPNTALTFGSPEEARQALVSGELLEAVKRAFDPSSETGSPAAVVAIRVDPAVQASLQLRDVSATVVATLTTTGYGLRENQVKAKVEAATGGRGLKLTTQRGNDFYTQDNVFRNVIQIRYAGAEASGVLLVNGTTVTLQAPSGTPVATIDLATYKTVQELADRIGATSGFTAVVQDGNGDKPTLQALDFVTAQDVKTANYIMRADLQAAVDWFNSTGEGFTTCVRASEVGTLPAAIPFTYLTGGTDGTVTSTQWSNALAVLQTKDVQWVVPCTSDAAVHAMVDTHVAYMSGVGRKERRSICGSALATSDDAAIVLAKAINSDRTSLVHLGGYDYDANNVLTLYPPYIVAAMIAGAFAGVNPGTPLTAKSLKLRGLERDLRVPTDTDALIRGGVIPLENSTTGFRIVKSISTWLTNTKFNRVEQSVGVALDFTARTVRDALAPLKGTKGTPQALGLAVSLAQTALRGLSTPEPNGPGVLAGDDANPAFRNLTATLEGDVVAVSFEASPVIPINYIPVTIFAKPYSGSASLA